MRGIFHPANCEIQSERADKGNAPKGDGFLTKSGDSRRTIQLAAPFAVGAALIEYNAARSRAKAAREGLAFTGA
jgi:hypothetical protein